jgi:uncharacterized protein (TIGR03083 family)
LPVSRDDVLDVIRAARDELDRIVAIATEDGWSKTAYEGWTARELLSHVAASSGVAGFLLAMARNPGATFSGEADDDAFNAQQVAARRERTVAEVAAEARGHLEADLERVAAAPDDLLSAHYRAPWGIEGPLAGVMLDSLREHLMVHLRDLAQAVA